MCACVRATSGSGRVGAGNFRDTLPASLVQSPSIPAAVMWCLLQQHVGPACMRDRGCAVLGQEERLDSGMQPAIERAPADGWSSPVL